MNNPTDRHGGLLAWQLRHYHEGHTRRRNLVLHALTTPLFMAGTLALLAAPFTSPWLAVGALAMVATLVLQGRGHGAESARPIPFRGPGDLAARFFVEQWVTFPRFVLGGGFTRAWRAGHRPPSNR
jgi:uncharacterized membrane protein YGL010W